MRLIAITVLALSLIASTPALAQTYGVKPVEEGEKLCHHVFQITEWVDTGTDTPPEGCEYNEKQLWGNIRELVKYPVGNPIVQIFKFTYTIGGKPVVRYGVIYLGELA